MHTPRIGRVLYGGIVTGDHPQMTHGLLSFEEAAERPSREGAKGKALEKTL